MSAPSTTADLKPTDEQLAVLDFIRSDRRNLDINALAGAAKSTTLKMAAPLIREPGVILAFNFAIKQEIEKWAPSNFTALTLNGLGHRAWQGMVGRKINVKDYKINALVKDMKLPEDQRANLVALVKACKSHGLVPHDHGAPSPFVKSFVDDSEAGWEELSELADVEVTEELVERAKHILRLSIAEAYQGNIDFADQIYMSCCFGATFPRYRVGFVDEAQDLSSLNHYMVKKCLQGGRFIGVGDERQSIYAFRGAASNSISMLREAFQTETLDLTTTFRCAQALVRNVHWHAPAMRAAPWAPEGKITHMQSWGVQDIQPESMVICRNNAPLFAVGFAMLQSGIPINFLGKGLEQGLTATIMQVCKKDPSMAAERLHEGIEDWRATENRKAEAVGNDAKVDRNNDKADALLSIPGRNAGEILGNLSFLLNSEHGSVTLCTGHKSKGLERKTVYHLEKGLIGRGKDLSEGAKAQENNLKYVVDTRAKTDLIYIDRKGWQK